MSRRRIGQRAMWLWCLAYVLIGWLVAQLHGQSAGISQGDRTSGRRSWNSAQPGGSSFDALDYSVDRSVQADVEQVFPEPIANETELDGAPEVVSIKPLTKPAATPQPLTSWGPRRMAVPANKAPADSDPDIESEAGTLLPIAPEYYPGPTILSADVAPTFVLRNRYSTRDWKRLAICGGSYGASSNGTGPHQERSKQGHNGGTKLSQRLPEPPIHADLARSRAKWETSPEPRSGEAGCNPASTDPAH